MSQVDFAEFCWRSELGTLSGCMCDAAPANHPPTGQKGEREGKNWMSDDCQRPLLVDVHAVL